MKKILSTVLTVTLAALMLAAIPAQMTSCALNVKAEELSAGYVREATEAGKVTEEFKTAMANFSLALTNTTVAMEKESKTNHLVSPLSALICLSMLANGAKGETLAQMEAVLGMPIDELNKALYAYTSSLYTGKDCKVSVADSIWYRDGDSFTVRQEFLQTCADWYQAQQYAAPFDETTRGDINKWVEHHTDGMIDSILEEPIPADAVMYVVNALVFDAKWEKEYEKKDIRTDTFTSLNGTETPVTLLCSEESRYLTVEGGFGVAKPYKGSAYCFVGLLPEEGTNIYDFAASLDGADWTAMWQEQTRGTVYTRIPEFTYDSGMELTAPLGEMGMTDLFDLGRADLSGIGTASEGKLYCDGVYQKTFIQVDRNGTKAAAVTWGSNKAAESAPIEPKYVYLDRPFVYAIVDTKTGLPLFVGVVTEM